MRTAIGSGLFALAAAALLFSQAAPRRPAAAERLSIDATVTDAAGHIVPDLTAADFEVFEGGKPRQVADAAYLRARTASPAAAAPIFNIVPWPAQSPAGTPGETHLTLALVLDDLRLSTEARNGVRLAVEHFIDGQMQSRDVVAIVRTAGGTGALQQLTSDKHLLHAALDLMNRQPAGASNMVELQREDLLADTTLALLRTVLDGLRPAAGPKAVVLFSENMKLYSGPQTDSEPMAARANRSSVVFYTVDPRGLAAAPAASRSPEQIPTYAGLGALAKDTGGIFFDNTNDAATALARVLQDREGYYRIAFSPAESADSPGGGQLFKGITVKVKRAGLLVRSRLEFPRGNEAQVMDWPEGPLSQLLPSQPFASGGIHLRLTPLVSYSASSSVEALLEIDPKDITFTSDSKDFHNAGLELAAAAFAASKTAGSTVQNYALRVPAERFKRGLTAEDLPVAVRWPVMPGPLEVHVVVRDTASGRVGSARQFLDFPDFGSGQLLLSGIFLTGAPGAAKELGENPTVRIFKPGRTVVFTYSIFNARVDAQKNLRLEVRTRVFREGQQILACEPVIITSSPETDPARRARSGSLALHRDAMPGRYALEIAVTDSAANPPRTAVQSIDFEVR